jgi:2-amino-4-hydroxy-6-hydroxymethyldihydropteridine diphosphokinase
VTRAWIAFGANLGDRAAALDRAQSLLEARGVTIRQRSRLYASRPEGGVDEPEYGNAVLDTETSLDARTLLSTMRSVEEELGRPAAHGPGPRTCDLDLLAFDDLVVNEAPGLVLPHPRLHQRAFVLVPLVELDPQWRHPVSGETAGEMLAMLPAAPGEVRGRGDAASEAHSRGDATGEARGQVDVAGEEFGLRKAARPDQG